MGIVLCKSKHIMQIQGVVILMGLFNVHNTVKIVIQSVV